MNVLAGTSGFAFPDWKPLFYPSELPNDRLLAHYATRLPTVEINASFYRMPTADTLQAWKSQVPTHFRFAIKAHRRITHVKRLRDVDGEVRWLHERLGILGGALGPVLFQCPPSLRRDDALLEAFLAALPPFSRVAVEFRHASWYRDEVYQLLHRYGAALCIGEDDGSCDPLVHTAPFGYYRLHRLRYNEERLRFWADHLRSAPIATAFCYFTHDTGPEATTYALRLMAHAAD
ncbi:MAG: DUF72 domain-containing protein [Armatimonadota bacterium]|nr:DUF72 domain-containing protein [Armatimonadota bacterium]MDR5697170.1 DUF72 domain-containing protein [Armatimonadota bacterium]